MLINYSQGRKEEKEGEREEEMEKKKQRNKRENRISQKKERYESQRINLSELCSSPKIVADTDKGPRS